MSIAGTTILIIEDHRAFRDVLARVLGFNRYRVITAEAGQQGLELAQREQPDVVILDLMMPGLDGYETCRRLRAMPGLAQAFIIILTASADQDAEPKVAQAGADLYLHKPCSIKDLEIAIAKHLHHADK